MTSRSACGEPFHLLLVSVLAALLFGCGAAPGDNGSGAADDAPARKIDVAAAGDVTLTVWDQNVRGGQARQIRALNRAFQERYPNVRIERQAKSFTDLNTTLKLAASSDKAPDVVQANQGHGVMGQLVKAGLLRPLDEYAGAYGWQDRYTDVLLDLNRFTPDGRRFGEGRLYGLSQAGEVVGVFYDKRKIGAPPRTLAEFEQSLAEAKQEGDIPIQFGNLDKWPGIHLFQAVQTQFVGAPRIRDFVFARDDATFDTPQNREAAGKLQEWVTAGYLTPNFNGVGYDPAWQRFAKGQGRFLIAGTWLVGDLEAAMGDDVGFFLMPPRTAGDPHVALGGEDLPWAITSKSEHPDVAAAYVDFLTSAEAMQVLINTGNVPASTAGGADAPPGSLLADAIAAWKQINKEDGLVPYVDYATPSFYDQITAAIQEMLARRVTAEEFAQTAQRDYAEFLEERE